MTSLAETQRWMLGAMTAGAQDAEAFVRGSDALPAQARVALYRTTYHRRLVGCLRETYPGLRHALGDELFDDFALDYVAAHPPRGHSLATLGAAFPDHLAATRPDDERGAWADFLVDLARLERAFHEVYDGPPGVRVVRCGHPVDEYLAAVRRGEDPPLPGPQERTVALERRDWVVMMTRIE